MKFTHTACFAKKSSDDTIDTIDAQRSHSINNPQVIKVGCIYLNEN